MTTHSKLPILVMLSCAVTGIAQSAYPSDVQSLTVVERELYSNCER